MRPEIMEWCENRPVTIRHNRVGSFGFMLATIQFKDYYIDWGDGVVEQKQFNNWTVFSHTYAEAGVKTIIIRNLNPQEVLKFRVSTSTIAVSGLDVSCAINIEELNFYYCQNAFGTRLPTGFMDNYKKLTKFNNGFYGFTSLESIPVDLFRYNTAVTTFGSIFYGCSSLTSLPVDLFRYNTNVTNFGTTFRDCNKLTSLPVDLFRYNTKVTTFESTFFNTKLDSVPVDLFRYNTAVTNFGSTFHFSKLTSVPVDLFRYNTAVTTFASALSNNNNLTGEINMPEARLCNNLSYFASSTKITKINFPENFAADVDAVGVDMSNWISDCYRYNSPVSINFKLKVFKIWSSGSAIPIPSIRLLNQNSTFTGSTPQVDVSGVALNTEAANQLLADLPSGLTDKTIKLRTGTSCDATIATNKGWSVIYG